MTIQINFTLHGGGEYEEVEGTCTSCLTAQDPIRLSTIRRVFPFEGEFHFRLKSHTDFRNSEGYVWKDIFEDDIIPAENDIVDIQALCLSLPALEEDDTLSHEEMTYMQSLEESLADASLDTANRPDRKTIKASHFGTDVDPITLVTSAAVDMAKHFHTSKTVKSMTKTAGSLWNSMKSAATSVGLQLVTPVDNLDKLHNYFCSQYDDSSSKHKKVLEDLWEALFPGYLFETDGPRWKTAGFQNMNPVKDLKGSGILSLKAMLYMGSHYPEKTQSMLVKNASNIKTNYPFAVVGINMTILLCDILGIREKRYAHEDEHTLMYYEIFEDRTSFYEIYCFCFFLLDHLWTTRNAIRKDFSSLIGEVKSNVSQIMDKYPHSVKEFNLLAKNEFDIDVHQLYERTSY